MNKSPRFLRQSGFTLIELMVSLVLGLLIVLALVTLLVNVNSSNSELGKTNRVIENGRSALQLLQADISHAGYWGGFIPQYDDLILSGIPSDYPTGVPDPCLAYATPWSPGDKSNLIGVAVQGYEIAAVVPSPTLTVCADKVVSPKGRTDVLVVRHVSSERNCVPAVSGCLAPVAGALYLQIQRCGSAAPSPAYSMLAYDAATVAVDFSMSRRNCTDRAEMRRFLSSIYYIRDYAVTAGDGVPTLMRSQLGVVGGVPAFLPAEVLIEGIEGFRVEFGVDNVSDSGEAVNFAEAINWANAANLNSPRNRGDGIADNAYIRCTTAVPCTAAQLANVVAVKIYVLVRSENMSPGYSDAKTYVMGSMASPPTLGPFSDGYKRHLFTQTVRVTNVSTRRETP